MVRWNDTNNRIFTIRSYSSDFFKKYSGGLYPQNSIGFFAEDESRCGCRQFYCYYYRRTSNYNLSD